MRARYGRRTPANRSNVDAQPGSHLAPPARGLPSATVKAFYVRMLSPPARGSSTRPPQPHRCRYVVPAPPRPRARHLTARWLRRQRRDVVPPGLRIHGHDRERFGSRLGCEHPVERVAGPQQHVVSSNRCTQTSPSNAACASAGSAASKSSAIHTSRSRHPPSWRRSGCASYAISTATGRPARPITTRPPRWTSSTSRDSCAFASLMLTTYAMPFTVG